MANAQKKKRKYIQLMTNQHTASYCYLRNPDEGREFSDGKYKTTILIEKSDKEGLAIIQEACKKAAFEEWGNDLPKGLKNPIKDGAEKADKDPSLAEYYMVTFKAAFEPALYNAAGKELDKKINVFSGDQIRVAGAASAYISGANKGVTLYLNAVQLVHKNADRDMGAAFGVVEGGYGTGSNSDESESDSGPSGSSDSVFNF